MVFVKPYVAALSRAGLRLADVQIVDTPLERELVKDAAPTAKNFFLTVAELFVRQLIRGEVDAIATPLPAEIVRFFDLQKIYDTKDDPDVAVRTELRMLTVSGAALREHRDRLVQLLARLIAAGAWAANNPDDARRHLPGADRRPGQEEGLPHRGRRGGPGFRDSRLDRRFRSAGRPHTCRPRSHSVDGARNRPNKVCRRGRQPASDAMEMRLFGMTGID